MPDILAKLNHSILNFPGRQNNIRSKQGRILFYYILFTLRQVKKLLREWEKEAALCTDLELRKQALSSIHHKDFHCQGGAVLAVPHRGWETLLVRLITAYQTLCDYLDNLCDRAGCTDGQAFRQLHLSLEDALSPGNELHDYYRYYPLQNDKGYIEKLVQECRSCVQKLPSYNIVHEDLLQLAGLYIDLQVIKHIDPAIREKQLINWAEQHLPSYPGVLWQEFAAASGSTLAIFALLGLATGEKVEKYECRQLVETYFPWICGLHILLDYFIDQEEDRQGGDLNFTFYYPDHPTMIARFKTFITQAHKQERKLGQSELPRTVVEGLLAMYLSDQKVPRRKLAATARELMQHSGRGAVNTYHICRTVRKFL